MAMQKFLPNNKRTAFDIPSLGQWLYWDDTAWRTDEIQLDRLAEETVYSFAGSVRFMTAQIAMISLNGRGGQVADKDRGQWSTISTQT